MSFVRSTVRLLSLFALLGASNVFSYDWKGVYAGLFLGVPLLRGSINYLSFNPEVVQTVSGVGYYGGAMAGYMHHLNNTRWIIAGEALGALSGTQLKKNIKGNLGTYSVKHKAIVGFSFLAGMIINPKTVAYGKVQVDWNRFALNYQLNNGTVDMQAQSSRALSPGCGIMVKIHRGAGIRLEYLYASIQGMNFIKTSGNQVVFQAGYKPYEHRLSFAYFWCF